MTPRIIRCLFVAMLTCLVMPATALAAGPYTPSNIGYDLSFTTLSYPADSFHFGIVGVTRGKAFTHNTRFASEVSWTKVGGAPTTVYMNLNAPYGSTVAGHISTPKSCPSRVVANAEPTECEGYNYGYNAAQDAFAYAKKVEWLYPLWWLDVEEANSWSATTTVNAATIQGAIDYLNTQGIRVGVYSMPFMWRNVAGKDFVPTQVIGGVAVSIPTWLPIGITNQVGALNKCVTAKSFITGSPIWLIQYVLNSKAVDQNVAC